ncbi:C39 family peptidase [Bacillus sp. JJ722]|uniref:C39 family peptidase n=1 Tax=Bacillus sp. JJ722 TaxID=3122973 RepID=UPI002FFFB245
MLKQLVKNSLYYSLLALMIGVAIIFISHFDTIANKLLSIKEQRNNMVDSQTEEMTTIETPEKIHTINETETNTATKPLDVPLIQQLPELPRGCEVTSLAMILQYNGIFIDKMELAEKITYEPFQQGNYKGNMNKGFVGDMKTFENDGLGVYVDPIIQLAELYVDPDRIVNITGTTANHLYDAVDNGYPVWVITNSWFKELPAEQFLTWNTAEGPMKVTYRQHSVVITHYDNEFVYVNDPLKNKKNIPLNKRDFEAAWVQMNQQAMYITS